MNKKLKAGPPVKKFKRDWFYKSEIALLKSLVDMSIEEEKDNVEVDEMRLIKLQGIKQILIEGEVISD